eukprot:5575690-Amphidinium_carterae.2
MPTTRKNNRYSGRICRSHDIYFEQDTTDVAISSAEAELYALGSTMTDVVYMRNIIQELKIDFTENS